VKKVPERFYVTKVSERELEFPFGCVSVNVRGCKLVILRVHVCGRL